MRSKKEKKKTLTRFLFLVWMFHLSILCCFCLFFSCQPRFNQTRERRRKKKPAETNMKKNVLFFVTKTEEKFLVEKTSPLTGFGKEKRAAKMGRKKTKQNTSCFNLIPNKQTFLLLYLLKLKHC